MCKLKFNNDPIYLHQNVSVNKQKDATEIGTCTPSSCIYLHSRAKSSCVSTNGITLACLHEDSFARCRDKEGGGVSDGCTLAWQEENRMKTVPAKGQPVLHQYLHCARCLFCTSQGNHKLLEPKMALPFVLLAANFFVTVNLALYFHGGGNISKTYQHLFFSPLKKDDRRKFIPMYHLWSFESLRFDGWHHDPLLGTH